MNCLSKNAANKIKSIGDNAAKVFLKESTALADKMCKLGRGCADYIRKCNFDAFIEMRKLLEMLSSNEKVFLQHYEQHFAFLRTKSHLRVTEQKMLINGANDASLRTTNKVAGDCNKLVGIFKLRCIAQNAVDQIKTTGNVNAAEIKKVASSSATVVADIASKLRKISGFESLSKKMGTSSNLFKTKGNKLANKVATSSATAAQDVQRASGLQSVRK